MHVFDHAVLLRAMRGDELLAQIVASDQRRVVAAGKEQSVVGSQQERLGHGPQAFQTGR